MSKLAVLDELLERYYQLRYHQNADVLQRLKDVQTWQKQRILDTHINQFQNQKNALMAEFFLNRVYGSSDFDALAEQIARLVKYAHKAEKLIPENAIYTGTSAVALALLAVELDEEVAIQLLKDFPDNPVLTDEIMRVTYLKLDQGSARLKQLQLLDELGIKLDKYMRSFVVQTAFKMCKGAAIKYRFEIMYEFMQEGFHALKPLKSAEKFVIEFTQIERKILDKVHAGHHNPFHL